jgi:hypothetical protein
MGKKLARWRFTSFRVVHWANIYDDPLGFPLNGKKLINGIDDIPSEYQLSARSVGDKQYFSRTSFAKTLNWLRSINHKVNPKPTMEEKREKPNFMKELNEKRKKRPAYFQKFNKRRIRFKRWV